MTTSQEDTKGYRLPVDPDPPLPAGPGWWARQRACRWLCGAACPPGAALPQQPADRPEPRSRQKPRATRSSALA